MVDKHSVSFGLILFDAQAQFLAGNFMGHFTCEKLALRPERPWAIELFDRQAVFRVDKSPTSPKVRL